MDDLLPVLRLLLFLGVESAVAVAAWRFARRVSRGRTVALDAWLISFAVRYVAVAVPGVAGVLSPATIAGMALVLSAGLLWTTRGLPPAQRPLCLWTAGGMTFVVGYVAALAWQQRYLPAVATDALVYHLPAAAQWLRDGRINLFPTWFFNPANTFSPLGGSAIYTWYLGLLGDDVVAHLAPAVAVPMIYLAVVAAVRGMGGGRATAALAAAALCVSRPVIDHVDKTKDDLFLLAFFGAAVVALLPRYARGRFAPWRLGLAVGLFLSIKFTALLAAPLLLLLVGGPWRRMRRGHAWWTAAGLAAVLAGPWYVRNLWLTGNPLFPTASLGLPGLFTPARSLMLRTSGDVRSVLFFGPFAVPQSVAMLLAALWTATAFRTGSRVMRDPVARLLVLGPPLGLGLFLLAAPYAEVRFLLPTIFVAVIAVGVGDRLRQMILAAVLLFVAAITGVAGLKESLITFLATGLVSAAVTVGAAFVWRRRPDAARRWARVAAGAACVALIGYAFVNWTAFINQRQAARFQAWNEYAQAGVWAFVDRNVPSDAVVAYANTPLVYPLGGRNGVRPVVYVPVRPGLQTPAELPYLGDRLPGERINAAAIAATIDQADEATWLANLARSRALVLAVFNDGTHAPPPERAWADARPERFTRMYEDAAGAVYRVRLTAPPPR